MRKAMLWAVNAVIRKLYAVQRLLWFSLYGRKN